jgi:hypothetical protein
MKLKKRNKNLKLFIVRKYIFAKSIEHVLKIEKKCKVDDCWVDDDFRKAQQNPKDAIGFEVTNNENV